MVIQIHPVFAAPSNTKIRVWRYMDLSKFIWLLQRRALYFCRCDMLGDPYEGYITKNYTVNLDQHIAAALQDPKVAAIPNVEQVIRSNFGMFAKFAKSMRTQLFVNCWHMNEFESPAMWKLYASHHDSICIQSTYERLAEQLPETCFLGMVKYIDYNTSEIAFGNMLNFIVHKRVAFSHEHELRAVIWESGDPNLHFIKSGDQGRLIPVNVEKLVERIFISPDAQPILQEIVTNLAITYGVPAAVIRSEAYAGPDY